MSHDELKAQVADLAIGALEGAEARRVEAHLAGCPECAAELASLRGTAGLFRSLPELAAPAAGEASLLEGARRAADRLAEARHPAWRVPRWLLALALGGAGAAAAVLVTLQVGRAPESRFAEGRGALEGPGTAAQLDAAPLAERPAKGAAPAPPPAKGESPAVNGEADRPAALAAPIAPPAAPASAPAAAPAPPQAKAARREAEVPQVDAAATRARDEATSAPAPARRSAASAVADATAEAPRAAPPSAIGVGVGGAPAAARAEELATGAAADLEGARQPDPVKQRAAAKAAPGLGAGARMAAPPSAPEEARSKAPSARPAAAPPPEVRAFAGCPGEARRTLWRDQAGRLVRREREGRLGGVTYRITEAFDEAGRPTAARLEAAGRTVEADRAGLAEGRLEGLPPGLVLAPDAAAAEAAPPRCGP